MPNRAKPVATQYLALAMPLEEIEYKLWFAKFLDRGLSGHDSRPNSA
jgi:hypothetical protein